jgi:predicted PurR-regulated permease PerM
VRPRAEGDTLDYHRALVIDVRALTLVLGGALALWLAFLLRDLFVPFAFAAALVLVGAPLIDRLAHHRVPRAVGAALYLALLGAALLLVVLLVVPTLVQQVLDVVERLPRLLTQLDAWVETTLGVRHGLAQGRAVFEERLSQIISDLVGGTSELGAQAASLLRGAASFASAAGLALMVPVLVFFALAELEQLRRLPRELLPASTYQGLSRYAAAVREAMLYLLRGQLFVALALMVLYLIGLTITDLPFPLTISVVAGLAYFLPVATTPVLLSLSLLFALLEPDASLWRAAIGAGATAAVGQVVESWFLTPRIVGRHAGLPPLFVIVAILVGGQLAGFTGVLFSLPFATALAAVVRAARGSSTSGREGPLGEAQARLEELEHHERQEAERCEDGCFDGRNGGGTEDLVQGREDDSGEL